MTLQSHSQAFQRTIVLVTIRIHVSHSADGAVQPAAIPQLLTDHSRAFVALLCSIVLTAIPVHVSHVVVGIRFSQPVSLRLCDHKRALELLHRFFVLSLIDCDRTKSTMCMCFTRTVIQS